MKKFQYIGMCLVIVFGIYSSATAADSTKDTAYSKNSNGQPLADVTLYFDTATGHQYVKNSDTTYTEYSKRGYILRTDVPADQHNLLYGKWTHAVGKENYLLYEKTANGEIMTMTLPANNEPLVGWNCTKLLHCID